MRKQIKQLGKDTLIYGFGQVLKRSIGFLLIPIYTRFLDPADYGHLELLNITLSALLIVISQGLGTAFFRNYADIEGESGEPVARRNSIGASKLISTSYNYLVVVSIMICGLLFVYSGKLGELLFNANGHFDMLVKLVVVTVFFQTVTLVPFQLMRANLESAKYVIFSSIQFLLQLLLSIYFVVVLKLAVEGILLAGLIGSCFIAVATFAMMRKHLHLTVSTKILKDLLVFGLPLIPAALSFWILTASDRFLLQKLANAHELGLYSLGSRFSSIVIVGLVAPFQVAWGPMLFQIAKKDNAKETFKVITTYFLLALCTIGALIVVFMPLAIRFLVGREFWSAYHVITPLVFANIASGMFIIFAVGTYLYKKTQYSAYVTTFGALSNVGLNFLLIPKYGMMGAAVASVASYLSIMLLTYHTSQHFYYIPYEKIRFLKICSIFLAVAALGHSYGFGNVGVDLLYRIGLMILFCVSFYFTGFFKREEKLLVKSLFSELQRRRGFYNKLNFGYQLIKN